MINASFGTVQVWQVLYRLPGRAGPLPDRLGLLVFRQWNFEAD